jgi:hypothetical protein
MSRFFALGRWALLACLCTGLVACSGRGSTRSDAAQSDTAGGATPAASAPAGQAGDRRRYPDQVEQGFLKQCTASGGSDAICRCTLDKVEQRYNLLEFSRLAGEMNQSGQLNPEILGMVNACRIESR